MLWLCALQTVSMQCTFASETSQYSPDSVCCGTVNTVLDQVQEWYFCLSCINSSSFPWSILVYRPVYSAGLWLLRHHQGDRPEESHRPDQTARLHWGDPRKYWPQRKLMSAIIQTFRQLNKRGGLVLILGVFVLLPSCRSILLQRTGCTKRPGACFWSRKWWIVPQWSWSGMSRMRRDWSSSCVTRNSSGEPSADSLHTKWRWATDNATSDH